MKIIAKLLTSLLVIVAFGGCARHAEQAQPFARPAPYKPEATLAALDTTENLVCTECHTVLTVDTGKKLLIAFSHEKHRNRGYHCNQCHAELGHPKEGATGQVHGPGIMPGHPQCLVCHDGKKAANQCEFCHLTRSAPSPHPPDYLAFHGKAALHDPSNCKECHNESFCQHCHTLPMPHPRNWASIHGKKLDDGDCVRCHAPQYCSQCHQRTRPASHRKKTFVQTHGGVAGVGGNCLVCHSNQFCLNCHKVPMPHPSDWTSAHTKPGKTQTDVCMRCHQVSECRTCPEKLKIMGHPAEFLMAHITETPKIANPDCRVCHAPSYCAKCHPKGIDGKIFPGGK